MRKITDFMVKGRYVFLALFFMMALFSLYLSTKVTINEDMMKYLPASSEVKIGNDLMEEKFPEQKSSILNVMFKDLKSEEKMEMKEKLQQVEGVSSVDYEDTSDYNQEAYTLYVLNVDDYDHSSTSTKVYNYVKNHFDAVGMSGSIYDENKPILPLWIVLLAIACAMVILITLSDSYLEPWLYLISIGVAVFINKGTNIIFDNVSSITNSIVAILQLALSMDYSIMLSNRYKQEKKNHTNKVEAMKEALYHSFKSIFSSSLTTVVGLVALVFMSFTIGRDLGFVLAKGVLLSLISIFFCLPALLLIFDNLITKTKKKTIKFNLTKLGHFVYKTRYPQLVFIVILFIAAYFLKGNIGILYTGSEQDEVGKVFPATNQIALVYNNKYEEEIASYCKELEKDNKIDEVLCYSNTINEKLAYDEFNQKLKDLGQDVQIEDYLLKLVYYHYYNKDENNKMTLEEFTSFIKSDIYHNEDFSNTLDEATKEQVDLLENFTSSSLIYKQRTPREIARLLNMSEKDAQDILLYYNSKNISTQMTIKEFIDFMLNEVTKEEAYAKEMDVKTTQKLKQLQTFTNLENIHKKMNAHEISLLFGIDENVVEQLCLLYRITNESTTQMTLNDFATFALKLSKEETYKDLFSDETTSSLLSLQRLSDDTVIEETLNPEEMKNALSHLGLAIDDENLSLLYTIYTGYSSSSELTLNEFATLALEISKIEDYQSYFSEDVLKSLQMLISLNTYYDQKMSNTDLYQLFGIDEGTSTLLNFILTNKVDGTFTLTPLEFVDTLLNNSIIAPNLSSSQSASLKLAQYIMNNTLTTYRVDELSNALSQDKIIVSFVYGIKDIQNNQMKAMSLKDFINFLYLHQENSLLTSRILSFKEMLDFADTVVNNTKTLYSYNEISTITKMNPDTIKQLFGIYDYTYEETFLTPVQFTDFLLNNQEHPLLKDKISNQDFASLTLVHQIMTGAITKEKYTSSKMSSLLNIDVHSMNLLFSLYDAKHVNLNPMISLKDFVCFIVKEVMNDPNYASKFDQNKKGKLTTAHTIITSSLQKVKYTSTDVFSLLKVLNNDVDKSLIDLVYLYYGSCKEFDSSWKMTIEEVSSYLNSDIITDTRFDDFIDEEKRNTILDSKETIRDAKELLVSDTYSRAVLNTKYAFEGEETYPFIHRLQEEVGNKEDIYVVGNSPMALELNQTFDNELNKITLLTMIFIFAVVAFTFKDLIIPLVLVLIIQTAVYLTMSVISLTGGSVYFISLLIVQAILMGATIDYAIVYTSYYRESRLTMKVKDSIINAYNKSIHTIISSSTILIIVTLVVASCASEIAAKICETISQGTLASAILILFVLPGVLAATDKLICRNGYYKDKKGNA